MPNDTIKTIRTSTNKFLGLWGASKSHESAKMSQNELKSTILKGPGRSEISMKKIFYVEKSLFVFLSKNVSRTF